MAPLLNQCLSARIHDSIILMPDLTWYITSVLLRFFFIHDAKRNTKGRWTKRMNNKTKERSLGVGGTPHSLQGTSFFHYFTCPVFQRSGIREAKDTTIISLFLNWLGDFFLKEWLKNCMFKFKWRLKWNFKVYLR